MKKEIKKYRTYRQLDEYFNELIHEKYVGYGVEEYYDSKYNKILNISYDDKDICVNIKHLPLEIRYSELLYNYLKDFTSFKSYTVSEW